jgi:nickel/cobalt transporter (NicO) family protein
MVTSHGQGDGHSHSHDFSFLSGPEPTTIHGPELQRIDTGHGVIELSIFEYGVPPRFRLSGPEADRVQVDTLRESGAVGVFIRQTRRVLGAPWTRFRSRTGLT